MNKFNFFSERTGRYVSEALPKKEVQVIKKRIFIRDDRIMLTRTAETGRGVVRIATSVGVTTREAVFFLKVGEKRTLTTQGLTSLCGEDLAGVVHSLARKGLLQDQPEYILWLILEERGKNDLAIQKFMESFRVI